MIHIMIVVKHGVITNYSLTDAVKEIGNLTRLGLPRRKSQSPYSQITNVVSLARSWRICLPPDDFRTYEMRIISCRILGKSTFKAVRH